MSKSPENRYYVVWIGMNPGLYSSWSECKAQVEGWKGALYKGFKTLEEAREAFSNPPELYLGRSGEASDSSPRRGGVRLKELPLEVIRCAFAVDAACSGNPGAMEYRGVYLGDMQEKFHFGPIRGTNNVGEFLAIVHALALLKQRNLDWPIYSDSQNAILWVRARRCKTKLQRDASTEILFNRIEAAERWLSENNYPNRVLKWQTDSWGEIPADFGRK